MSPASIVGILISIGLISYSKHREANSYHVPAPWFYPINYACLATYFLIGIGGAL